MFCGNCGVENSNGAKFCKNCGKPLGNNASRSAMIAPSGNNNSENNNSATANLNAGVIVNKAKALPKKFIACGCVAVILLATIIVIALNYGKTINLNKYLIIEPSGYDGYGNVQASINWDAIEAKYGSKLSFTSAARSEYGDLLKMMTPIEALKDSVSVTFNENSELSNGKAISYTWDVDEDLNKYVTYKIKYKDGSYTVSGLTEVGTFDAFADLSVEFSGISPNGNANLNYLGSELNYYDFSCDKTNQLKNGDTVKVTIDNSRLEYFAETLGKVPQTLEKEYKVEGLESYVSSLSEIDEAALNAMKQQATDVYNAYAAQNWGEGETLENLTYIGDYLLTAKNPDSWFSNNFLFLVYKAQIRNSYSNEGDTYNKLNDAYWFIRFENLMVSSDGTVKVDVMNYSTPSERFTIDSGVASGWIGTQTWYYDGYETLDNLYKSVVTANMDSYSHEDNVDESVAPETVAVEEEQPEITVEEGYIFPNSGTELLSDEDLEGLTAEECKIARNEIYARHGRKFKDEELQKYFENLDWYEGTIDPDDFDESKLNEIEIKNKDLIVEYEKAKGFR